MDSQTLLEAERSLLSANWSLSSSSSSSALDLVKQTTEAAYQQVLSSPLASKVLSFTPFKTFSSESDSASFEATYDIPSRLVSPWSQSPPESLSEAEWELVILSVGVSFLQSFIQTNYTGPLLSFRILDLLPSSTFPESEGSAQNVDQAAISSLSYLGEPAYHLAQNPAFLVLASRLLSPPNGWKHVKSGPWWLLRATRAHHQTLMLNGPLPLPDSVLPGASSLLSPSSELLPLSSPPVSLIQDLRAALTLEIGLVHHLLLGSEKEASNLFIKAAKDEARLEWELTGALGKRTKWQEREIGQLVVLARGRQRKEWVPLEGDNEVGIYDRAGVVPTEGVVNEASIQDSTEESDQKDTSTKNSLIPETLLLNDDTLLEKTEFTPTTASSGSTASLSSIDPSNPPVLHPLDQSHLLSLPLIQSQQPESQLTTSQLTPFTAVVLSSPQNWSVHTTALLLRSRAEAGRTRTVERSVLQLQALVDQIPLNDDGKAKGIAPAKERLRFFWVLVLPSKWDMEGELAERLVSLGVFRSALEIYERLEMWEKVVACYNHLEQQEKALAIVNDLLSGSLVEQARVTALSRTGSAAPSQRHQIRMSVARRATLLCMLADLEQEGKLERYTQAWEESNHTSSRAARSIAAIHYTLDKPKDAIPFFEAALAINPLYSRSWFVLGCAYVKEENWKDAVNAFRRVVSIEEEDAEGWANLASCYLRMGDIGGLDGLKKVAAGEDLDDGLDNEDVDEVSETAKDLNTQPDRIPHANKILAHRALGLGLRHAHRNWRMWSNYLLVCVDLGENTEACRALTRVVEERADKVGEECIDLEVLDRLVASVTRDAAPGSAEAIEEASSGAERAHTSNSGRGLLPFLSRVLEDVILARITTSPRIFQAHAKLLLWQGRMGDTLDAHLKAYRAKVSSDDTVERDLARWKEAVQDTQDIIETLIAFGPRALEEEEKAVLKSDEEGAKLKWKDWKFQGRSLVRTFMGRTKDSFEDQPEWDNLKETLEDLKNA
ncbi:Uncharacterized conserved protein, contains TPR repeats [Phaffia rhodozyma]|uniref:Uncharacterized conserved protein, contains TPR repeats n=1 Tax=Phaffia rhodozyma TaxID=264483 RepID=A0A0F7SP13_PHARH|nr:Uncharacterized conserved protein, contains TPR repeats [Phaffia rhodozyma]